MQIEQAEQIKQVEQVEYSSFTANEVYDVTREYIQKLKELTGKKHLSMSRDKKFVSLWSGTSNNPILTAIFKDKISLTALSFIQRCANYFNDDHIYNRAVSTDPSVLGLLKKSYTPFLDSDDDADIELIYLDWVEDNFDTQAKYTFGSIVKPKPLNKYWYFRPFKYMWVGINKDFNDDIIHYKLPFSNSGSDIAEFKYEFNIFYDFDSEVFDFIKTFFFATQKHIDIHIFTYNNPLSTLTSNFKQAYEDAYDRRHSFFSYVYSLLGDFDWLREHAFGDVEFDFNLRERFNKYISANYKKGALRVYDPEFAGQQIKKDKRIQKRNKAKFKYYDKYNLDDMEYEHLPENYWIGGNEYVKFNPKIVKGLESISDKFRVVPMMIDSVLEDDSWMQDGSILFTNYYKRRDDVKYLRPSGYKQLPFIGGHFTDFKSIEKVYVVEGVKDWVTMINFMYKKGEREFGVLLLPGITYLYKFVVSTYYFLKNHSNSNFKFYLSLDNDDAGHMAMTKLANKLPKNIKENMMVIDWQRIDLQVKDEAKIVVIDNYKTSTDFMGRIDTLRRQPIYNIVYENAKHDPVYKVLYAKDLKDITDYVNYGVNIDHYYPFTLSYSNNADVNKNKLYSLIVEAQNFTSAFINKPTNKPTNNMINELIKFGEHLILTAPTGSGKTYFFKNYFRDLVDNKISDTLVVMVEPLTSLARDIDNSANWDRKLSSAMKNISANNNAYIVRTIQSLTKEFIERMLDELGLNKVLFIVDEAHLHNKIVKGGMQTIMDWAVANNDSTKVIHLTATPLEIILAYRHFTMFKTKAIKIETNKLSFKKFNFVQFDNTYRKETLLIDRIVENVAEGKKTAVLLNSNIKSKNFKNIILNKLNKLNKLGETIIYNKTSAHGRYYKNIDWDKLGVFITTSVTEFGLNFLNTNVDDIIYVGSNHQFNFNAFVQFISRFRDRTGAVINYYSPMLRTDLTKINNVDSRYFDVKLKIKHFDMLTDEFKIKAIKNELKIKLGEWYKAVKDVAVLTNMSVYKLLKITSKHPEIIVRVYLHRIYGNNIIADQIDLSKLKLGAIDEYNIELLMSGVAEIGSKMNNKMNAKMFINELKDYVEFENINFEYVIGRNSRLDEIEAEVKAMDKVVKKTSHKLSDEYMSVVDKNEKDIKNGLAERVSDEEFIKMDWDDRVKNVNATVIDKYNLYVTLEPLMVQEGLDADYANMIIDNINFAYECAELGLDKKIAVLNSAYNKHHNYKLISLAAAWLKMDNELKERVIKEVMNKAKKARGLFLEAKFLLLVDVDDIVVKNKLNFITTKKDRKDMKKVKKFIKYLEAKDLRAKKFGLKKFDPNFLSDTHINFIIKKYFDKYLEQPDF